MDQQRGRPVLIEFWDFCRVNSLPRCPTSRPGTSATRRTGCGSSRCTPRGSPGRGSRPVREAVERLGIEHPVLSTPSSSSGPSTRTGAGRPATCISPRISSTSTSARAPTRRPSWPSASCWAGDVATLAPVRPEDAPEALIVVPTPDHQGRTRAPTRPAGSGRCSPARGQVTASTAATIDVEFPGGVSAHRARPPHRGRARARASARAPRRHAVSFTAGLAPEGAVPLTPRRRVLGPGAWTPPPAPRRLRGRGCPPSSRSSANRPPTSPRSAVDPTRRDHRRAAGRCGGNGRTGHARRRSADGRRPHASPPGTPAAEPGRGCPGGPGPGPRG